MAQRLRMAEAQQLYDGLNDALLRPALEAFFAEQLEQVKDELLAAVRLNARDTLKESRLAGMATAYEDAMRDLAKFAEKQLTLQ